MPRRSSSGRKLIGGKPDVIEQYDPKLITFAAELKATIASPDVLREAINELFETVPDFVERGKAVELLDALPALRKQPKQTISLDRQIPTFEAFYARQPAASLLARDTVMAVLERSTDGITQADINQLKIAAHDPRFIAWMPAIDALITFLPDSLVVDALHELFRSPKWAMRWRVLCSIRNDLTYDPMRITVALAQEFALAGLEDRSAKVRQWALDVAHDFYLTELVPRMRDLLPTEKHGVVADCLRRTIASLSTGHYVEHDPANRCYWISVTHRDERGFWIGTQSHCMDEADCSSTAVLDFVAASRRDLTDEELVNLLTPLSTDAADS